MKKIISLKIVLLVVIIMISNFCFGQIDTRVYFGFDSSSLQDQAGGYYENDYYQNNIIRRKVFFNEDQKKVKDEFIRVNADKYLVFRYDTVGKVNSSGIITLNKKNPMMDTIPILDSIGELEGHKIYADYFFYKDEDWTENIDSITYAEGRYKSGKKDSVWTEVKNNQFLERQLFYQNGVLKKIEIVNQISKTNAEKIKTLCKKWGTLPNTFNNIANLAAENAGGNYLNAGIEFKKDGTYFSHYRGIDFGGHESGTWSIKNNKIIMISSKKTSIAVINYLSDTYLSIAYEQ